MRPDVRGITAAAIVLSRLQRLGITQVTAAIGDIAAETQMPISDLRHALQRLRECGHAVPVSEGVWRGTTDGEGRR